MCTCIPAGHTNATHISSVFSPLFSSVLQIQVTSYNCKDSKAKQYFKCFEILSWSFSVNNRVSGKAVRGGERSKFETDLSVKW